ncbi:MAG: sensor histidine kinase [Allosphingosinicella sp.]
MPTGAAAARPETADSPDLLREQAAAAHYRKMYERASALAKIGVWECDLATEQLTWTDGVYDLFELPRGTSLQRSATTEMYDPHSRREMERARAHAIETGNSFGLDILIRTARGNWRWLHLTGDVERENGRSVRIFGTKQDITDARIAQDKVRSLQTELIQVSRRSAMDTMAATLAHELNQPLASLTNFAAGLRRALAAPELPRDQLERGVEAIEATALRAGNIIRSLREIASGNPVTGQPIDPNGLIREAAGLADVSAGIVLHYRLAEGVVMLADPVQFQQVMINLIRNAADAVQGSPRREVIVSTAQRGDAVEIRVDDSGPGIAPEVLPSIFDAFVTSKPGGLGVGLAICRTIVEAHGGRIFATNGEAGGASFRLTLPLASAGVVDLADYRHGPGKAARQPEPRLPGPPPPSG